MIWFFQREGARLHFEIRQGVDEPAFELVVTYPDGTQQVEQFDEPRELARRSCAIRAELLERGWQLIGDG